MVWTCYENAEWESCEEMCESNKRERTGRETVLRWIDMAEEDLRERGRMVCVNIVKKKV